MATHTSKSYITEIKYSFTKCETILNTQQDMSPCNVTKYMLQRLLRK